MGKATGMDAQRGKMTWPAVHGVQKSREDAKAAIAHAQAAIEIFGERGAFLRRLAAQTLVRTA